ncbi:uncharacterized protein LOC135173110 [Diachasmimorpha longicaudata]|uniref:uncharacterized protein LOC135173110 n=1 Tax=Diachasmimorpha longicaudata TaxID=58733 RepID=UPI0030B8D9B8
MHIISSVRFIIFLVNLCVTLGSREEDNEGSKYINPPRRGEGQKMFLFYKSNAINERPCSCPTQQSCSCCEDVTLLLIKAQRRLCANLMYQRNGLNIDISLDSNTVRSMTVTNYRPLKVCTLIPGSLFSGVCLNLVELNAFPRSVTVCPRFQITTKGQEWRINYTCVSISTELPMANVTTPMAGMSAMMPGGPMNQMIVNSQSTPMPNMMAGVSMSQMMMPPPGSTMANMMSGGPMNQMTLQPQRPTTSSPGTTTRGAPGGIPGAPTGGVPGGPLGGGPPMSTAGAPGTLGGVPRRSPGGSAAEPGGEQTLPGTPQIVEGTEIPDNTSIELAAALTSLSNGQSSLKAYGATDRTKYFPSRLPPAYAASFRHNFTVVKS